MTLALRTLVALCLASLATAAPKTEGLHRRWLETRGETLFNVFKRDGDSTSLAYVENSGICVSPRVQIARTVMMCLARRELTAV